MVPFRSGLADHLTTALPNIRVEWLKTGHMLVLSKQKETAAFINEFAGAEPAELQTSPLRRAD